MDQYKISNYLALSGSENSYSSKLLDDFYYLSNNKYYHYALNIYHNLFMLVLYQSILKTREFNKEKFGIAVLLLHFDNLSRNKMLDTTSAFDFSIIHEKRIVEFLKLLDADNNLVNDCKKLVEDRNKRSHANGYYFSDEALFEEQINKYDDVLFRIHSLLCEYLLQVMDNYINGLDSKSEITKDDLEIYFITPFKLNLNDLQYISKKCNPRRKIQRQIKDILDEDFGVIE